MNATMNTVTRKHNGHPAQVASAKHAAHDTHGGHEDLSAALPRASADVEAWMAAAKG